MIAVITPTDEHMQYTSQLFLRASHLREDYLDFLRHRDSKEVFF